MIIVSTYNTFHIFVRFYLYLCINNLLDDRFIQPICVYTQYITHVKLIFKFIPNNNLL